MTNLTLGIESFSIALTNDKIACGFRNALLVLKCQAKGDKCGTKLACIFIKPYKIIHANENRYMSNLFFGFLIVFHYLAWLQDVENFFNLNYHF